MLTLGQQLIGKNIMSLRIGRPIGAVTDIIINPNNLRIEGWHAIDSGNKQQVVLLPQDIRDILLQGFVVDDHDALTQPNELIRLKEVLSYNFNLIGKNVVSNQRRRIGKINDYAFDKDDYMVYKLYVSQSVFKSFSGGALMIDRSQIIEITDKKIVIDEATVTETSPIPVTA